MHFYDIFRNNIWPKSIAGIKRIVPVKKVKSIGTKDRVHYTDKNAQGSQLDNQMWLSTFKNPNRIINIVILLILALKVKVRWW